MTPAHPQTAPALSRRALLATPLVAASVAAVPGIGGAQVPSAAAGAGSAARLARFAAAADQAVAALGAPGGIAAFLTRDGEAGVAATGLADRETGRRMRPNDRLLPASIGKSFVAATALALSRRGGPSLDAKVATLLGDRPWFTRLPNHRDLTLRLLLSHQGGLADHVHAPAFAAAAAASFRANPRGRFEPEALVAFVLDTPPLFPAGQGYAYSDTGYIVAGLAMEAGAGKAFPQLLREVFLDPIGLTMTDFVAGPDLPGLVPGYVAPDNPFGIPAKNQDPARPGQVLWNPGNEWTGGGTISNPQDLVVWASALYGGTAIPGKPYLEELTAGAPTTGGVRDGGGRYGLGVRVSTGPFGERLGHGGWIPGYRSDLTYWRAHGLAVAIQVNTDIGLVEGDSFASAREALTRAVLEG